MLSTPVESSMLASVAYHAPHRLLCLEFRTRAIYYYFGVPPAVHQRLLAAPSKGTYFNRNIRGRFPHYREPDGAQHAVRTAQSR